MRRVLGVLFIFVVFVWQGGFAHAQVNPPPDPPRAEETEMGESGATREELSFVFDLLEDFRRSLERIFHPVEEISSPLPVRLGSGVSPRPELVFEGGSIEGEEETEEYGVLGAREPEATSFFVREAEGGVRSYSLTGDFTDLTRKGAAGSNLAAALTEPESRGKVWGARISRAEEEISNWFKDSGVILCLLGIIGLVVVVGIVGIVLRIVRRRKL